MIRWTLAMVLLIAAVPAPVQAVEPEQTEAYWRERFGAVAAELGKAQTDVLDATEQLEEAEKGIAAKDKEWVDHNIEHERVLLAEARQQVALVQDKIRELNLAADAWDVPMDWRSSVGKTKKKGITPKSRGGGQGVEVVTPKRRGR